MEEKLLNEQELSEVSGGATSFDVCIKDPENKTANASYCNGCRRVIQTGVSGGSATCRCGNGILGSWLVRITN